MIPRYEEVIGPLQEYVGPPLVRLPAQARTGTPVTPRNLGYAPYNYQVKQL